MRRKIQFLKLFNDYDNYSTEIQFALFQWMISTGWKYQIKSYPSSGVFEQIYGLGSVNSQHFWYDYGFSNYEYITKMQLAFVRAIISDDCLPVVKKWREENGIGIDKVRYLNLKISDEPIEEQLKTLFNAHKSKLSVQLNKYWPQAVNIDSVLLSPNQNEWVAILMYGFDGSSSTHTLASQGNATFSDFLTEACKELDKLTTGESK